MRLPGRIVSVPRRPPGFGAGRSRSEAMSIYRRGLYISSSTDNGAVRSREITARYRWFSEKLVDHPRLCSRIQRENTGFINGDGFVPILVTRVLRASVEMFWSRQQQWFPAASTRRFMTKRRNRHSTRDCYLDNDGSGCPHRANSFTRSPVMKTWRRFVARAERDPGRIASDAVEGLTSINGESTRGEWRIRRRFERIPLKDLKNNGNRLQFAPLLIKQTQQ